jgi:hypoxanthine phosphoribosyltransferase
MIDNNSSDFTGLFGNLDMKIDDDGNIVSSDMVHSVMPPYVLTDSIYKLSKEIYDYMNQREISSITLLCMDIRSIPLCNMMYFLLGETLYDFNIVFFDEKSKIKYLTLDSNSISDNNFLVIDLLINSGTKMKAVVDVLNNCGAKSITTVAFLKKINNRCRFKNVNFHAIIDIKQTTKLIGFGLPDKKGYFSNLNTFTTAEELAKIKYHEAGEKLEHLYEPLTNLESIEYEDENGEEDEGHGPIGGNEIGPIF